MVLLSNCRDGSGSGSGMVVVVAAARYRELILQLPMKILFKIRPNTRKYSEITFSYWENKFKKNIFTSKIFVKIVYTNQTDSWGPFGWTENIFHRSHFPGKSLPSP